MKKVRYMISDAANMMQVESHVLRYWEEELELDVPRNEMGQPPCIFRARTVATSTDTSGFSPDRRHLTFQNFSKPMSAAKPDSVT